MPSSLCAFGRDALSVLAVTGIALLLFVADARAADPLAWESLSGEQQYILAAQRARWATLDGAQRRELLRRADIVREASAARAQKPAAPGAPAAAAAAAPAANAPATKLPYIHPYRSRPAAGLDVHSSLAGSSLRKALRRVPGLTAEESREIIARWPQLSPQQRVDLVTEYAQTTRETRQIQEQAALLEATRAGQAAVGANGAPGAATAAQPAGGPGARPRVGLGTTPWVGAAGRPPIGASRAPVEPGGTRLPETATATPGLDEYEDKTAVTGPAESVWDPLEQQSPPDPTATPDPDAALLADPDAALLGDPDAPPAAARVPVPGGAGARTTPRTGLPATGR